MLYILGNKAKVAESLDFIKSMRRGLIFTYNSIYGIIKPTHAMYLYDIM